MKRHGSFKLANVEAPVTKTREQLAAEQLSHIEQHAAQTLLNCTAEMNKFAVRFRENAFHALEWSAPAFNAAARERAALVVQHVIEKGKENQQDEYLLTVAPERVLRDLRAQLYEAVRHAAQFPEMSTSAQSNAIHVQIASAKADWLEKLDRMLENLDKK